MTISCPHCGSDAEKRGRRKNKEVSLTYYVCLGDDCRKAFVAVELAGFDQVALFGKGLNDARGRKPNFVGKLPSCPTCGQKGRVLTYRTRKGHPDETWRYHKCNVCTPNDHYYTCEKNGRIFATKYMPSSNSI